MGIDIAVVGLAGRFPQSLDVEQFWTNLVTGTDCITHFDAQQLVDGGVPEHVRTHPDFVAAEPVVPEMSGLDAQLFGLTPREAAQADPQLRLFLESCHAALENAGYDPFDTPGRVAVYGATGTPVYLFEHLAQTKTPSTQGQLAMLNNGDYFATQVSYRLNLTGPAMTVLTACSSSLTAAHLAARALEVGECDVALAGGAAVDLDAPFGYFYAAGSVRSPDGRCRPFDASGSGTVFGGGAGVVVLKRLADAQSDGDHVLAVIRGTAVNNDGSDKRGGFGAPSVTGQVDVINRAMRMAGALPSDLSYVEAHATGTSVGDPIEVTALEQAWDALEPGSRHAVPVGSVKSNIGHAAQAAGVAGLIKLVLAFDRRVIPPSLHVNQPLPRLLKEDCRLSVAGSPIPFERDPDRPRTAAISSFGAGGTNVHMVLTDAPLSVPTPPTGRERVVPWSAQSEIAADALAPVLADFLAHTPVYEDAVTTQQRGRTPFRVRRAAVLDGPAAAAALTGSDAGRAVVSGKVAPAGVSVVFAFPGQGSLVPQVCRRLAAEEPRFARHLAAAFELFGRRGDTFATLWRDGTDATETTRTGNAQPVLFALEWALFRTWADWGVHPDVVVGHSLGEIVAATVAGVFTPEAAATAVLARADAMQAREPGAMAAVFASEAVVVRHLGDDLDLCAVNGERETVVGGPQAAVADFIERMRAEQVRSVPLRTSHAFHTRSMAAARDQVRAAFGAAGAVAPRLTFVSAATGHVVTDEVTDPDFFAGQLVSPVRFRDAAATLAGLDDAAGRRRGRLVVELGPGQTLTGLLRSHEAVREAGVQAVSSFAPRRAGEAPERHEALTALATAWTRGATVDWSAVDAEAPERHVPVPGYRYQRQPFWVDAPPWQNGYAEGSALDAQTDDPASTAAAADTDPPVGPGAGVEARELLSTSPFSVISWLDAPRPAAVLERPECALVLLPADRGVARRILVAAQRTARDVVAVRPGAAYQLKDRSAVVDPADPAQLARLLADLRTRGQMPDLVVHSIDAGLAEPLDDTTIDVTIRSGFLGLFRLVQALAREGRPPRTIVLTAGAVDVSGSEALAPGVAAAVGLVRSWPLEDPSVVVRLIDLDARTGEEDLVDELAVDSAELVVALRGARRWTAVEVPFEPRPAAAAPIRRKGVYLVTGGSGGLGRAVLLGLARTGLQPSIVLVSRSGTAGAPELAEAVEEAESLGCRVKVLQADVAVRRDMRRVVDVVSAQLGAVAGVFHLAGVAGDGVIAMRDLKAVEAVLAPKVSGTLTLHGAVSGRVPLDFWVNFTSRAAVTGLAGSADYAGANAFLDAWGSVTAHDDPDLRVLSISWPSWAEVGMAAAGLADAETTAPAQGGGSVYREPLDPDHTWALDEHRIHGVPVLPGAAHVDLVVRAYRKVVSPANAVHLHELVFAAPLSVDAPLHVEVEFVPDGAGHRFSVRSVRGGVTLVHSTGSAAPIADGALRRRVDLDLLRESLPPATPTERLAEGRTFVLGQRWACATAESTEGERTLVELRLPEPFAADLGTHPLHPAMLDCATSNARVTSAGAFVPFMYGDVLVHDDLPGSFVSSITRTRDTDGVISADIDLIAPDGEVLVEIRDFTMRAFHTASFVGSTSDARDAHEPERPGPTPRTRTRRGIPPDVGVDLLMQLLGSRTPPHVVVRPFVDGRPEPLEPRSGRPAEPRAAVRTPDPVPTVDVATSDAPATSAAAAPGDDAETRMRAVWIEVLGVVDLEPDDDFFDVGGTSLSAIEVVSRIRAEFGAELSIATLLESPTIAALAVAVAPSGATAR